MKIIYVFERRHCYKYDYDMFQFDSFLKHSWEVECWSAVNWTFSNIDRPPNEDTSERSHYINHFDDLIDNLERIKGEKCFFLVYPYHAYGKISYTIRKYIKKYGFEFANITESPAVDLPFHERYTGIIRILYLEFLKLLRILVNIVRILFSKKEDRELLVRYISNRIYSFWGPFLCRSKFNYVTVSSVYASFPNLFECKSKRNILIHSNSYDEFIVSQESKDEEKSTIVFIDCYHTGHSDYPKNGMNFPISNKESYFENLNRLFKKLEDLYDCEVVIAAHPKSEYSGHEFGGRSLIYGKTNILIKMAKLVIVDISTCFGVIVLFKKDFLNVYTPEMFVNAPRHFQPVYKTIHNIFGCRQLDITDRNEIEDVKSYIYHYNRKGYEKYLKYYVKDSFDEMCHEKFYDTVYNTLKYN